jgi:hypothetical protein
MLRLRWRYNGQLAQLGLRQRKVYDVGVLPKERGRGKILSKGRRVRQKQETWGKVRSNLGL